MPDVDCVDFLRWALPQLRLRWTGFRKVRHQVCKRIRRRVRDLDLPDLAAYRRHFAAHPDEWRALDAMCRVTISRFYRDKAVFDTLASTVLPQLARRAMSRDRPTVTVWSAGCSSGEEPYTVALLWEFMLRPDFPRCRILVLGTDGQPSLLHRAQAARYPASALRDLPVDWLRAFERRRDEYQLQIQYRASVHFAAHDLRTGSPGGAFDLLLCRNLAFTYWDETLQLEAVRSIERALRSGGVLMVGAHEGLPPGSTSLIPRPGHKCMFDRR